MIRIKQVSVKLYIKRPLRKGVSYRHPQLSPQSLFSKKTDVLVHWLMSHAHRRLANSTSFREQQLTCRNRFEPGATLGCETPTGDKEGFFFFYCWTRHPHPRTVGLRPMPVWSHHTGAKDDTSWDCADVLFLRPDRAFPYNRGAVLWAEKVQCVAGPCYWRTPDAAPAARRAEPQRQSGAWGLRVSRPVTEGWYSRATVWDLWRICSRRFAAP